MVTAKEEKEQQDPLVTALMERYLFDAVPTLELSNPKVLLSCSLWLLLIAKDKLTMEDLFTSRKLEGAYLQALRASFQENFSKVFGDNQNKELLEEILGYFKIIAQQYIAQSANKHRNQEEGLKAATLLVDSCHFANKKASELCLRVETLMITQARGAKAANLYRTAILELDPNMYSLRGEAAVSKIAKMNDGSRGGVKGDPDDDDDAKKRKKGKSKRKCVRCKKGPFTFAEFQEHNKTCK